MTADDRTWLVLLRDISHAVRIPDEPRIVASLIFDIETGVVLASRVAADEEAVLAEVCEMALTQPAGGLVPSHPGHVSCSTGLATRLTAVLRKLTTGDLPEIEEVECVHEAEDVFDSFVAHLAGRQDPKEYAEPSDWQLLFEQVLAFYDRQPWARWADDVDLLVDVRAGTRRTSYVAIVLGNADVEYGLVLYRGKTPPAGLRGPRPARPMPTPRGTLMLTFDAPEEVPPEFVGKALRYGWPQGSALVPVILSVDEDRSGEPSRDDVRALTVALAAVIEHDGRGPVLVETTPRVSAGAITLARGGETGFTIRQLPPAEHAEDEVQLRFHFAGTNLVPSGTPIVMGAMSTSSLSSLRRDALIYRPRPAASPSVETGELPLIVVVTDEQRGDALAASVAEMDPFGVSVAEAGGVSAVVLVGAGGAEMLMELPTADPALRKFRSRLKASKGVHAILVADEASARGEGKVYGLFECHLPDEAPRDSKLSSGERSSVSRRRKRR